MTAEARQDARLSLAGIIAKFGQCAFDNIRTDVGDSCGAAKVVSCQYDPLAIGASQLKKQLGSSLRLAAPH
jgi:hypothetical protein